MNKIISNTAWKEYIYWQTEDKKILKKINELIKDIEHNGNTATGKPEAIKMNYPGFGVAG